MDIFALLMFCIIFCLALVFSMLSINLKEGAWAFLGMVCWFSFAGLILVLAPVVMYVFSYLFLGIGFIFLVAGIGYSIEAIEVTRKKKEQDNEWEMLSE